MDNFEKDMDRNIPYMDFGELESIVNAGVKKRTSFIGYLSSSFKELGIRNIFHDKNELIVIGLIGIAVMIFSLYNIRRESMKSMYTFVFSVSPVLYFSVVAFSFYNSKEKGAFDLEMTCKYNLFQLTALRMFTFSIANIIINSFIVIGFWTFNKQLDVVRLIIISITGIFLFSTVFLYSLLKLRWMAAKYLVMVAWIGINMGLSNIESSLYLKFLMKAPIYIHLFISIICGVLYIRNLIKLISYRRKKGEI